MHPFSPRQGYLGLYLAAWTPLAALQVVLLGSSGGLSWVEAGIVAFPLTMLYAFVCLSSWYICRSLPLSGTSWLRLSLTLIPTTLLSSSFWLLIGRLWTGLLSRSSYFVGLQERFQDHTAVTFIVGILMFLLAVAAHYLAAAFDENRAVERRAFELKLLAQEAELKTLKFQINPHFLFNSLNSVSALTSSDPAGARRMCLLLAGFLRQSLRFGTRERITLQEELDLVRDYLEIERVRRSSALEVQVETKDGANDALLPPLLLQPLVENAVKHGIAHLLEGGTIDIRASSSQGRLRISVENPFDPEASRKSGSGLGLKIVEKRLASIYDQDSQMRVSEETDQFSVHISIPAEFSAKDDASALSSSSERIFARPAPDADNESEERTEANPHDHRR